MQLGISHSMDKVRCAVPTLAKVIAPLLYDSMQTGNPMNENLELFRQWVALLRDASLDHQSLDSRMACAKTISTCYRMVLIDRNSVLGECRTKGYCSYLPTYSSPDMSRQYCQGGP
jgi:hypothetical protein